MITKHYVEQNRNRRFRKDGKTYRLLGTIQDEGRRKLVVVPLQGDPKSQLWEMTSVSTADFLPDDMKLPPPKKMSYEERLEQARRNSAAIQSTSLR